MRSSKRMVLGLLAGLAACQSGAGPQLSHVYVRLTDAPDPAITAATATISQVYLIGANGRVTISTTPTDYELYPALNGVTVPLGDAIVETGKFAQLRLVVDQATVTLVGETEPRILKVPSGMESGIKVEFGGPIPITADQAELVVDFDVSQSFIVTGPTPPRQVLFTPVLHGTVTQ